MLLVMRVMAMPALPLGAGGRLRRGRRPVGRLMVVMRMMVMTPVAVPAVRARAPVDEQRAPEEKKRHGQNRRDEGQDLARAERFQRAYPPGRIHH